MHHFFVSNSPNQQRHSKGSITSKFLLYAYIKKFNKIYKILLRALLAVVEIYLSLKEGWESSVGPCQACYGGCAILSLMRKVENKY